MPARRKPREGLPKLHLRREAPPAGRGALRLLPVPAGAAVPAPFAAAAAAARFTGRAEQTLRCELPEPTLLVGAGEARAPLDFERAGGAAWAAAGTPRGVVLDARGLAPEHAAAFAAGLHLRAWNPARHRSGTKPEPPESLTLLVDSPAQVKPRWRDALAVVRGTLLARDLIADPANHLTPAIFADRLRSLEKHGIAVEVLEPRRLRKLGFGALLAVGGGSAHPPRLVVLRWRGRTRAAPVAFVGKGVCFDTGGISVKPASGMEEMTADMAGAAACAGAMLTLALRESPAPAVAVLPLAENAIGAASYRPGDVLRTLSGRTVEVLDTDAEGRLILADALHHAATRFQPQAIVDLATLTGSIVVALGTHRTGLFSNDDAWAAEVTRAAERAGEPVWRMPVSDDYKQRIESPIADFKNYGGKPDATAAALLLSKFAGETPWVHLDIAGTSWHDDPLPHAPKGSTGAGVRTLVELFSGGAAT
ncbi:MAG TPA: leucyl aminopeptidase [Acetobacteraceae bacterium]|nr:leucyl aminopeptidase [Acetobacteraceae bacterium]